MLGIGRTTLHRWVKGGAAIGLLRGERKLAYPLEQFADNRPLVGLADIVRLVATARDAGIWIRRPNATPGGAARLDGLRAGRTAQVTAASAYDFVRQRQVA